MNERSVSPTVHAEIARKLVHVAFGLCAVLLRWLTFPQAAALAAGAIAFNTWVLPRAGGRHISRAAGRSDIGIILYPIAVLLLIIVFHDRLWAAAAVWSILAFGDGFATIAGRLLPSRRLRWNSEKSLAGLVTCLVAGWSSAFVVSGFVRGSWGNDLLVITAAIALVCAIVESLPLHLDDNVTVPAAGALVLAALLTITRLPQIDSSAVTLVWLALNAALAVAGYAARSVSSSGMIGGFVLGCLLILCGGWELYVVLLAFFIIGSVLTRAGYERKARAGLAQERGGRRDWTHAFSNVGVAAMLAVLSAAQEQHQLLFWLAAVAALATATADTTGSEVGQWIGRRAFLPLTFRRVPVGTEGAISLEGTAAGWIAGGFVALIGALGAASRFDRPVGRSLASAAIAVAVAAALGFYVESIVGSWNRKRESKVPNGALNFFNTLVGALLFIAISRMRL